MKSDQMYREGTVQFRRTRRKKWPTMRRSFLSAEQLRLIDYWSSVDRTSAIASPGWFFFGIFIKTRAGISFPANRDWSSWTGSTDAPAEQWNATFTLTDVSNDPSGKPSEPKARELGLHDAQPTNALAIRCTPVSQVTSHFGCKCESRLFTREFRGRAPWFGR